MMRVHQQTTTKKRKIAYAFETGEKAGFEDLKKWIDNNYKRPAPVYSEVRKRCQNEKPSLLELCKSVLKQTIEERKASDDLAQERVELRNDQVTTFACEYIMIRIRMCFESTDAADNYIALQLASGLRQCEIFRDDLCEIRESAIPTHVVQFGQAKQRDGGQSFCMMKHIWELTGNEFVVGLARFRNQFKGHSTREISLWNQKLSRLTRFYFPLAFEGPSGTHINRTIYAALERHKDKNDGSTHSDPRVVQTCLGHTSMTTAPHYLHINVDEDGSWGPVAIIHDDKGNRHQFLQVPRRYEQSEEVAAELAEVCQCLISRGCELSKDNLHQIGFSWDTLAHSDLRHFMK